MTDSGNLSDLTYVYGDQPANGQDPGTRPLTVQTDSLLPRRRMKLDIPRRVGDFFIFLTSADRTKIGSSSERHRYITIGLLMLVTAAQALYSASLFMSIGLGKKFTQVIWFGIFFAVAVYLIDRSIIGFAAPVRLDKDGNLDPPKKTSWVLLVRIMIAIAAAILMSEMILLQVFAKDIQQQIQTNHLTQTQQANGQIRNTYQARINTLQQQIDKDQQTVDDHQSTVDFWYHQVNCQEFGCPGIPAGEGPGFRNAQANLANARIALQQAQAQLQNIRTVNDPQIAALEQQEQQAINAASPVISNADVVLSREEAFWQLTTKDGTVLVVRLLLSVLILGIDLAPVLTKITGRATMHDVIDQSTYYTELKKDRAHVRTEIYRLDKQSDLDQQLHDIEVATALFQAQKRADVERAQSGADADVALYKINFDAAEEMRKHTNRARHSSRSDSDPGQDDPEQDDPGQHELGLAAEPSPPDDEDPKDDREDGPDGDRRAGRPPVAPYPDMVKGQPPTVPGGADFPPPTPPFRGVDEFADLLFHRHWSGRRITVLNDRWELHGPLHQADKGGGGMVWRARDRRGRPGWFVVKTTPSDPVSMRTTARLRKVAILNEQRTQGIVSRNIGTIVDSGEDQGLSYIVYPLYQPGSLALYYRGARQQPTLRWCAGLISQVLAGLIDASGEGLVHLDIKPDNIVLDGTRARIIDWGLSRSWNTNQPYTEVVRGSPFFACPEQLLRPSRGWDTPLADLYSVGATFYWLLTGEAPLHYNAGGSNDLLTYRNLLVFGTRPQPVHELVPGVPRSLSALIDRWLSFQPRDRVLPGIRLDQALHTAYDELNTFLPLLPEMRVGKVMGRRRRHRRRRWREWWR